MSKVYGRAEGAFVGRGWVYLPDRVQRSPILDCECSAADSGWDEIHGGGKKTRITREHQVSVTYSCPVFLVVFQNFQWNGGLWSASPQTCPMRVLSVFYDATDNDGAEPCGDSDWPAGSV